jgi:hypothetical protein
MVAALRDWQNPLVDLARIMEVLESDSTPLIRTDFTDAGAWRTVVTEVSRPVDFDHPDNPDPGDDGFAPEITPLDDRTFDGLTAAALGEAFTAGVALGYALLADARAMAEARTGGEITLDYVDLSVTDPEDAELFHSFLGRSFRCAVREIASIDANLSIANMDFDDFAGNTDADGVFRGFADDE